MAANDAQRSLDSVSRGLEPPPEFRQAEPIGSVHEPTVPNFVWPIAYATVVGLLLIIGWFTIQLYNDLTTQLAALDTTLRQQTQTLVQLEAQATGARNDVLDLRAETGDLTRTLVQLRTDSTAALTQLRTDSTAALTLLRQDVVAGQTRGDAALTALQNDTLRGFDAIIVKLDETNKLLEQLVARP